MTESYDRNVKTHGLCKSYLKVGANATVIYCKTKGDVVRVCAANSIDRDHVPISIRSERAPILRQLPRNRSKDACESSGFYRLISIDSYIVGTVYYFLDTVSVILKKTVDGS